MNLRLPWHVWVASLLGMACSVVVAQTRVVVDAPQRLSDWLLHRDSLPGAPNYPLGLMWLTPEQKARQLAQLQELQAQLQALQTSQAISSAGFQGLQQALKALPPTGRVRVAAAHAQWLGANPVRDPMLQIGDELVLPARSSTLRVMRSDGAVCDLPHQAGLYARHYVQACGADGAQRAAQSRTPFIALEPAVVPVPDWAWVVQPDGRVQHVGLKAWNATEQDQPAPGAWLWLPVAAPGDGQAAQRFNLAWAEWLSTQGVSDAVPAQAFAQHQVLLQAPAPQQPTDVQGGPLGPGQSVRQVENLTANTAAKTSDNFSHNLSNNPTPSNWGNVGVLQTPTARMQEAGYFGLGLHRTWPYTHTSVMLQPFRWMEAGFRYTDISNRLYGPEALSGNQSYKDKSMDLKLQLYGESAQWPALALGWRDMGGTGLFSAEYLVASKRSGAWDASLGMSWGYLASRANLGNPLSRLGGPAWDVRQNDVGQGGSLATRSWFHGPAALFAGLQYQSPWGLVLKAELDPNHYQAEPLGNVLPSKTPFNWGVVHQPWRGVALSAGMERGNTWSFGVTFLTDLSGLNMPKVTDPPLQARRTLNHLEQQQHTASAWPTHWTQTARDLQTHTQWQIDQMYMTPNTLVVDASDSNQPYPQRRLDKAMALLHRDAPPEVQEVVVQHHGVGGVLAVQHVNRNEWATAQTQAARTQDNMHVPNFGASPSAQPTYTARSTDGASALLPARRSTSYVEPGLDFIHTLGGPDAFVLYQFSAALHMGLKLPGDIELKALARMRLLNNYNKFTYDAPSNLPRVRTYLREYFQASPTTLSNLSLSQTGRATRDVYWAAYGGYFEEMFGGVGGEVLYRQPGSRWAVGADVNQVRQRGFEQRLAFQDYRARTGHVTGYWMTPFEGVQASLAAGQYLAGDKGATLTLTRVFANGATMGAFATKTNVPAAVFGEGSFDKGIFWSVPFDALLTSTARGTANFMWKPLTRDGGAMVVRPVNLFQNTTWLDPNVHRYAPAAPRNDAVIPDDRIEPFARVR